MYVKTFYVSEFEKFAVLDGREVFITTLGNTDYGMRFEASSTKSFRILISERCSGKFLQIFSSEYQQEI